jgi:outer membrane lipoprotein-sorting protein
VREYYKRVRRANQLFTSYKEGWKTDRGMIFIVFGPPSRVFVTDKSEMWIYEKSFELPRVSFTFARIDTAFTNEHYVLLRNAEYQNLWYRVVDLWRKGKKEY